MKMNEQEIQHYLGSDWPCKDCHKAGAPNCRRVCGDWKRWRKIHWRVICGAAAKLRRYKKNR